MMSEAVNMLKGKYCVRAIREHKLEKAIIFCRTKLDCGNMENYLNHCGGGKCPWVYLSQFVSQSTVVWCVCSSFPSFLHSCVHQWWKMLSSSATWSDILQHWWFVQKLWQRCLCPEVYMSICYMYMLHVQKIHKAFIFYPTVKHIGL